MDPCPTNTYTPTVRMLSPFIFKYKGFVLEGSQGHRQWARGPGAQVEEDVRASWLPGAAAGPAVPCLCPGPAAGCQEAEVAVRGAGRGVEGVGSHDRTTLARLLLRATGLFPLGRGGWLGLPGGCVGGHGAGAWVGPGPFRRQQWLALGRPLCSWGLCQEGGGVP